MTIKKITVFMTAVMVIMPLAGCSDDKEIVETPSEVSGISSTEETSNADDTESVYEADKDTDTLSTPEVKDGVTLPGDDAVEVHFVWDKVEGADGYEVMSEDKFSKAPDDSYSELEVVDIKDRYYVTYAQDTFSFRIRVRAYKENGASRIYSEWSPYASGSTENPYPGLDSISEVEGLSSGTGTDYYEKRYAPVLEEYSKVLKKDSSLYGLRVPNDLYYIVDDTFESFNINDFYYTFIDLDNEDSDNLVIVKNNYGDDFVYAIYSDYGYYPDPIRFDLAANSNYYEELRVNPMAKEGEEILLYDKGIIAKSSKGEGYSTISYFKLGFEYVEPMWELIETVAETIDDNGKVVYYISKTLQSLENVPNEKGEIYEEITEKKYKEIRAGYENKPDIVRIPFVD